MRITDGGSGCEGNAAELVEYLEEQQPDAAELVIGDYSTPLDVREPWGLALRMAVIQITEDAGIDGGEPQWQHYLGVDQLAELVVS